MIRTPLLCRLLGHSFHVDASHYYCINHCVRCEREFVGGHFPLAHAKVRAMLFARWVRECTFNIRAYFCHCDECGLRFGRHRADIDHLPF